MAADHHHRRRRRRRSRTWSAGTSPPTAPGIKLVGDITYIRTWQGWLYLATVIDCHTKACIGYAMAEHMRTDLVIAALDMAARNYPLSRGCDIPLRPRHPIHVRRSSPNTPPSSTSDAPSAGPGCASTMRQAESFNAAVKVERVNRTVYPTREHARKDVTRYIEFRYNTRRLHSALGYRTPHEAYNDYLNPRTAA